MQIILRFVDSFETKKLSGFFFKTEKWWFSFSNTNVETFKGQF